jgi:heme/copper-type cytochrome/quinol oxidase subunit 2
MKKFLYILFFPLVFFPLISSAATSTIQDAQDVVDLITKIGNWMYGILLGLAVIFIIFAAYNFMTSGGSEEKVKEAKNQVLYTLIAVAVAMLAKGFISIIESLVLTN